MSETLEVVPGPEAGRESGMYAGSDADAQETGEPSIDEVRALIDVNGGDVELDEAHLFFGPGTFPSPTQVVMTRIAKVSHTGANGPVFKISFPAAGLLKQDAILTLRVPYIGDNQPKLALGTLDPSLSLADQQWVLVQGSALDQSQESVTGPVNRFKIVSELIFAAVIACPPITSCPSGQTCNSSVCQQCPTSSSCTP